MYKRILLKLSGEALQGDEGFGIEPTVLDRMVADIKELLAYNVQVGIVIGGGNLFRGAKLAKAGMNRVVGDHMGMLATLMNGLAVRNAFHRASINSTLMSAISLNGICEDYNWSEAIRLLNNGRVLIFGGGTGNPFFTTDSAACLRGIEIEAEIIIKATKVDGIYTVDPVKDPNATMFESLTYKEVIAKEYKVMDLTAFSLARDYKIPIVVCNINKPGALLRVVKGENEGTIIKS